ncbi:MAG: AAC(3) family N-acetyltransferase [Armatimonadetes bacterium]|nr:AAC(3) family N-acetyltransferase [Armatimonadota bacterium]
MAVTRDEIAAGLRSLGLEPGAGVFVHSSLRSFGHVEGGAEAVIGALTDVVGPEGTILMPAFDHGRVFGPGGPGIFDPRETPTSNGRIPDTFWRMPGVCRSLSPTHSFAARGRHAARYTRDHHLTLTCGEDSPLGLLMRDDGWQVNLGTTHRTSTAKHLAETIHRAPCLGQRTEVHPVRLPDGRVALHRTWSWRERRCPLNDPGDFIEADLDRLGLQRRARIGECPVTLLRLRDLVRVVLDLLAQGRDGYPPCAACPIRPRCGPNSVASDWGEG